MRKLILLLGVWSSVWCVPSSAVDAVESGELVADGSSAKVVETTSVTAVETKSVKAVEPGGAKVVETTSVVYVKRDWNRVALIPMAGGTGFAGNLGPASWGAYSLGLALEIPFDPVASFEIEGSYGRADIKRIGHAFELESKAIGSNLKLYLNRHSLFRTYVGAGFGGIHYDQISARSFVSEWVGAGQFIAGSDLTIVHGLALGIRGSYSIPMFYAPASELDAAVGRDAAAVKASFYKLLGTMRIEL